MTESGNKESNFNLLHISLESRKLRTVIIIS